MISFTFWKTTLAEMRRTDWKGTTSTFNGTSGEAIQVMWCLWWPLLRIHWPNLGKGQKTWPNRPRMGLIHWVGGLAGELLQCTEKHRDAVPTTIWGMEVLSGRRTEVTLGSSSRQQGHNPKTLVNLQQDPGSRWKWKALAPGFWLLGKRCWAE